MCGCLAARTSALGAVGNGFIGDLGEAGCRGLTLEEVFSTRYLPVDGLVGTYYRSVSRRR